MPVYFKPMFRGVVRTNQTSKRELFVKIVNGF